MQAAPASNGSVHVAGAQAPFPLFRKPPRHRAPVPSQVRFGSQARAGQRGRRLSQRRPHRRGFPTVQPCGATQARGGLESRVATLRPALVPGGRGPSARSGAGLSGLVSSAARSTERVRWLRPESRGCRAGAHLSAGAARGRRNGPGTRGLQKRRRPGLLSGSGHVPAGKTPADTWGERGRPSRFLLPTMPRPGARGTAPSASYPRCGEHTSTAGVAAAAAEESHSEGS